MVALPTALADHTLGQLQPDYLEPWPTIALVACSVATWSLGQREPSPILGWTTAPLAKAQLGQQ